MWVLLGPFDGEIAGDSGFQKPKLLKPNISYTVGRKERALVINNKRISHDHCDFIVGPHPIDDVSNPAARPSLKLVNWNKKDKTLLISRRGKEVHAYPSSHEDLQEEDLVTLITDIHLTVKWIPICVYSDSLNSFNLEDCASLGIKLVHTPHSDVTHHTTTDYTADLPCSASLLSLCQFVRPEWLQEVLRLGNLPRKNEHANGISLEDHFALPQESKYRPAFSPSLLPSQKKLSIWEPNEERVNLFQACRFVCLHDKITSSETALREVIHRGNGILENFDIHSNIQKFRKALSRSQAKEGKKTVVVGDLDSMQLAIGRESWSEFLKEAGSWTIALVPHSKIVQAVIEASSEILFETNSDETGPPSGGQSTRPRLVRRVTSRAASREPSVDPSSEQPEDPPVAPRRALTRRVPPKLTSIVKPSSTVGSAPDSSNRKTPPPELVDLTAPTPGRPTRLKRRFGLIKEVKETPMSGIEETIREPPLKKFKALFESSNMESMDPESVDQLEETASVPMSGVTQTQTESQEESSRSLRSLGNSNLAILQEEEEETQPNVAGTMLRRGRKRRLSSEDDVEMQIVDENVGASTSDVAEPVAKKRAVENVNAVSVDPSSGQTTTIVHKPPSTIVPTRGKTTSGAAPGKPDTDDAFLKAIASTKRGKKNEDEFDREFNKLKISKPELDRRDPAEWDVLADFGDDSGLRGNFVVIVEMDPYERQSFGDSSTLKTRSINCEWDGRPNFKKFKKKFAGAQRAKIELFASQENDYGMGDSYWKSGHSQTQHAGTQSRAFGSQVDEELQFESQSQSMWQGNARQQPETHEEDELPPPVQRSRTRKPPSKVGSAVPGRSSSRQAASKSQSLKPPIKSSPLFLQSDDEADGGAAPATNDIDEDETLKSDTVAKRKAPARRAKTVSKPRSKKKPVVVVDDDSDDAVFQGFKG